MANDTECDDLLLAEDALEGDAVAVAGILEMLRSPGLAGFLKSRGASETEARDLIGDIAGDCFGGERAKGGLHRLLGRYNGGCPLPAFFRHVALNRLISLKRRQATRRETSATDDEGGEVFDRIPDAGGIPGPYDDALISLLREALLVSISKVDVEKLVVVRLIESYGIPQKQVGALWGWHETKISRTKSDLLEELRIAILDEVRRKEPWLQLEWDDFLALCGESTDLFSR